jgi:hypothetical protein
MKDTLFVTVFWRCCVADGEVKWYQHPRQLLLFTLITTGAGHLATDSQL